MLRDVCFLTTEQLSDLNSQMNAITKLILFFSFVATTNVYAEKKQSGAWQDIKSGTRSIVRGGVKGVKKATDKIEENMDEDAREEAAEAKIKSKKKKKED